MQQKVDQNCMKMLEIELTEGGIPNAPLDPSMTSLGGHLPLEVSNVGVTFNHIVEREREYICCSKVVALIYIYNQVKLSIISVQSTLKAKS